MLFEAGKLGMIHYRQLISYRTGDVLSPSAFPSAASPQSKASCSLIGGSHGPRRCSHLLSTDCVPVCTKHSIWVILARPFSCHSDSCSFSRWGN